MIATQHAPCCPSGCPAALFLRLRSAWREHGVTSPKKDGPYPYHSHNHYPYHNHYHNRKIFMDFILRIRFWKIFKIVYGFVHESAFGNQG